MLPDVQGLKPANHFKISRVGVRNVKKPVKIERPDKTVILAANVDIFVNLPEDLKGSHMSRNIDVLNEVIDECARIPAKSLEELSARVSQRLLERHEYASYAEVRMEAPYFLERVAKSGKKSLESYKLLTECFTKRNGKTRKMIGVEVIGMTACPCAMETTKKLFSIDAPELENTLSKIPFITHNQRNITTLAIEVPEEYRIEADDLIDIVENSLSSPTYEILKRRDEAIVVLEAHKNPRFVEDVVRGILDEVLKKYRNLPDDVIVTVKSESEEAIHKHNAYAERVTTLGELRE